MRVDLHRHMGGSIGTDFVWNVVQRDNLYFVAANRDEVVWRMTFSPQEPVGFYRFLGKFKMLDEIRWTPDLIRESVKSVCDGLKADRIDRCWMDFSINKYMQYLDGWHKRDVVKLIREAYDEYAPGVVDLVLSLKYEASRASQQQYSNLLDTEASEHLIGVDLVGDEAMFDREFHGAIISKWRKAGKKARAHVGEYGGVDNVAAAIDAGVTNVAHGLKIVRDKNLSSHAAAAGISFDLGLTSNILTGVSTMDSHELRSMLDDKLSITLGTDDPVVCGTDLDREFDLASQMGATQQDLVHMRENAEKVIGTR